MALDLGGADAELLDPVAAILGDAWPARGESTTNSPTGYVITRRQERLYAWRADLFAPAVLDVDDDQAAADATFAPEPTLKGVPCLKVENRNTSEASTVGRTAAGSGNADIFKFPAGLPLSDGWLIKAYPPAGEALLGAEGDASGPKAPSGEIAYYIALNDPETRPLSGRRQANESKVLGLITSPPKIIQGKLLTRKRIS